MVTKAEAMAELARRGVKVELQTKDVSVGDATLRGRMALGLDPAIQALNDSRLEERPAGATESVNPYERDWGAYLMQSSADGAKDGGPIRSMIAKKIGGDDFQRYQTASSGFESAILPAFAGSAVTQSEAARFLKANQPQPGDSPEIVDRKYRNRQMIANGAARVAGYDVPFADVPTWGPKQKSGQALISSAKAAVDARKGASTTVPPPAQRRAGQTYSTPKGPLVWTGTGWRAP